mgnify:CR=1 FL=1
MMMLDDNRCRFFCFFVFVIRQMLNSCVYYYAHIKTKTFDESSNRIIVDSDDVLLYMFEDFSLLKLIYIVDYNC